MSATEIQAFLRPLLGVETVLQTDLALILPRGAACAFALDDSNNLVGLKIGLIDPGRPRVKAALFEWIYSQVTLQRLVLALRYRRLPPGIRELRSLVYVALNGIEELPSEILAIPGEVWEWEAEPWRSPQSMALNVLLGDLGEATRATAPDPRSEIEHANEAPMDDGVAPGDDTPSGDAQNASGATMTRLNQRLAKQAARAEKQELEAVEKIRAAPELRDEIIRAVRGLQIGGTVYPPPEILTEGRASLEIYYEYATAGTATLNEAKLLLVGHGGAGKTSIVKILSGEQYDPTEPQTHGINIRPIAKMLTPSKEITLNAWDFGGQEIMHATHQFFLSKRSVYLLVLDGRKEEQAEYWLKHIESFGGDSPIVVAINKHDENPGFDVNRHFLKEKYPGIVGFVKTSCSKKEGFGELDNLLSAALQRVEILKTEWPRAWFLVRGDLESNSRPFLSARQYNEVCKRHYVLGRARAALAQFLNDLGVFVHFPDFALDQMHVLDPRWLTSAVYKILNSPELARAEGELSLSSLASILTPPARGRAAARPAGIQAYPTPTHAFIVGVMRKFELCYPLSSDSILVPDLLPVGQPDFVFDRDALASIVYDYADFVPKSILPRLMVRMYDQIEGQLRWRTGVVLRDGPGGARALVRVDYQARRIAIMVQGPGRRDYLAVLRSEMRHFHRRFEKLGVTERIPLPDDETRGVSYEHLIRLEDRGDRSYLPEDARREYGIAELLGSVRIEAVRTESDFVRLLQLAIAEHDDESTATEVANDILILQPNLAGIGININNIIKWIFGERSKAATKKTALPPSSPPARSHE
jgi:small GTP-binding protein